MQPNEKLLSTRAKGTVDQPITFLMKATLDNPENISLAAGFVDQESLPADFTRDIVADLFEDHEASRSALQYGLTSGLAPIRKWVARRIESDGFANPIDPDRVVIGSGSQQLLFITTDCLCDRGDIVIVEDPTYFVYLGVLNNIGARAMGIPTDESGMLAEPLKERLEALEKSGEIDRLKILYLQTYYQNPMGTNISWERREELWEVVNHFHKKGHDFLVMEDAAYRDLRFAGEDIPFMAKLDKSGERIAIYGTFSKAFAPGMRSGWACLPEWLAPHVLRQKGNHDFGSSNLTQTIVQHALEKGHYQQQVENLQHVYRAKAEGMLKGIKEFFPSDVKVNNPQGGLYVWCELPADCPTGHDSALFKAALRNKVLYVPSVYCYCQEEGIEKPDSSMRLTYAMMPPDIVHEGLRRLGKAIEESRESISSAG